MKQLGENQIAVLKCLLDSSHRAWWPGCGWTWDNLSGTERILASLAKRGLVEKKPWDHGRANLSGNWHNHRWHLTETGKQEVLARSVWHRLKYASEEEHNHGPHQEA